MLLIFDTKSRCLWSILLIRTFNIDLLPNLHFILKYFINLNSFQHFLYPLLPQSQIHIWLFNIFLHLRKLINLSLQNRWNQIIRSLNQILSDISNYFPFNYDLAPINIKTLVLLTNALIFQPISEFIFCYSFILIAIKCKLIRYKTLELLTHIYLSLLWDNSSERPYDMLIKIFTQFHQVFTKAFSIWRRS